MRAGKRVEYYYIEGIILGETSRAIRFKIISPNYPGEEVIRWFPLSQISEIHRINQGVEDVIKVAEWILVQEDLLHLAIKDMSKKLYNRKESKPELKEPVKPRAYKDDSFEE